jgi:ABC-2 type transport system ATP-binding protein
VTDDRRLALHAVSKAYGPVVALDELSFDVAAGELFGFVGSNGAGKTTAMRIVLGVLAADSGRVTWDGAALTPELRRRIGYMPEERGLYPKMRVGDQLLYFAQLHGLRPDVARRRVGVWLERLGVAERTGDAVEKLSLGNQQRVQLAAALVHDPEILVLDEPFSGLDPVAVDVMSEVLRERCQAGIPVVFSSHQLELVERLCDRVGIVSRGRMVACDTVDRLRDSEPGLLAVTVDGGDAWADGLSGVTVVQRHASRVLLALRDKLDDQAVLQAALSAGPVREFAWQRPGLKELFRAVVSERAVAEPARPANTVASS